MKKVALIGLGKMGLSHFAIANSTDNMDVVAVCDTSKTLLRSVRKNLGINCYSDYRELLQNESLDAVIVSVPNNLHFVIVEHCLKAGIHVFIEKPLTLNYSQSLKLAKLATEKQCLVQVGYVNRFNPVFCKLKSLLDDSVLGKLHSYKCSMIGGVILEPSNKGWRNDYSAGGGCLYDYGPHCIDLAVFLFGENPHLESSTLSSVFSTKVDDVVEAKLIYQSGLTGEITVNWSDDSVRKATNRVSIVGEKGTIEANKQEIKINLNSPDQDLGPSVREHVIYVTDLDTSVGYYLRGEDFSRQLLEFSESINGLNSVYSSPIKSALVTDRIIDEIFTQNGVTLHG